MLVRVLKTFQSHRGPRDLRAPSLTTPGKTHRPPASYRPTDTQSSSPARSTDCSMGETSDKHHCPFWLLLFIKVGVGSVSPRRRCQAGHLLQIPLLRGRVGEIGHVSVTLEFKNLRILYSRETLIPETAVQWLKSLDMDYWGGSPQAGWQKSN